MSTPGKLEHNSALITSGSPDSENETNFLATNNHLLNGQDVAIVRAATSVLAANDGTTAEKAGADADCDASGDNTEMQASLDNYYSILLSSGGFSLSSGILFKKDGTILRGQGRRRTSIYTGAAIDMIAFVGGASGNYGANTVRGCKIADLSLCGHTAFMSYPQTKTANHGVMARYTVDFCIDNVEMTGFKKWACQIADVDGHSFRGHNLWLHDSGDGSSETYTGGLKVGSHWAEWAAGVSATYPHTKITGLLVENCYDGIWICQTAFSWIWAVSEGNERHACVCDYGGAGFSISPLFLSLYAEANQQSVAGHDIYIYNAESNDYHIDISHSQLGSASATNAIKCDGSTTAAIKLNIDSHTILYTNSKTNSLSSAGTW